MNTCFSDTPLIIHTAIRVFVILTHLLILILGIVGIIIGECAAAIALAVTAHASIIYKLVYS